MVYKSALSAAHNSDKYDKGYKAPSPVKHTNTKTQCQNEHIHAYIFHTHHFGVCTNSTISKASHKH